MSLPSTALATAILGGLALACPVGARAEEFVPPDAGFTIYSGEAEVLEIRLMAEVEANRSRHCPRRVLHGTPLPGEADADILAIYEDDEVLDRCYDRFAEGDGLVDWQVNPRGQPPPDVILATWLCEPIAAMVSRAVRHEDACSPFLVGRGVSTASHSVRVAPMRVAKAMALVAQDRARRGDRRGAIELLADTMRLAQDVGRGEGVGAVTRLVSEAASGIVVAYGIQPLLEAEALAPADLESLILDLSGMLDSEPPVAPVLDGIRQDASLQWILPYLKPDGWVPPGGVEYADLRNRVDGTLAWGGVCSRSHWVRAWIVSDAAFRRLRERCTAGMLPAECLEAIDREIEAARAASVPAEGEAACGFPGEVDDRDIVGRTREQVIDRFTGCFPYAGMMKAWTSGPYALAAVLLHARIRQERERTGRCPTTGELRSPSWAAWRIDPLDGGELRLVEEQPGQWVVHSRSWDEWARGWPEPYRITCVE